MSLFSKLDPLIFITSFSLGLFLVYVVSNKPDVLYQYPNPNNQDTVYEDDAHNCYKYKSSQTTCPSDKSKIKKVPLQFSVNK